MRRGRFRWTGFVWALGLSLAWHLGYVVPRLVAPFLEPPASPVEVSYLEKLPAEAPEAPDTLPKPPELPRVEPERSQPQPVPKAPSVKPPPVAEVQPPRPREPVPPPTAAVPPPPPLLPPPDHRKQMVDQDRPEDEPDNADARYLAQKNHRAKEETRARNTNLIREVKTGESASSEPSPNTGEQLGGKERKIAELVNRPGADKSLVRSARERGEDGKRTSAQPSRPGPLAMRDLVPRALEPSKEARLREGLEKQEPGPGELPMARSGEEGQRGRAPRQGGWANLNIDHHAYDNIEGFATAEKERQEAARAQVSHPKGRYERYLAKAQAMRSALENFTLDVKPGNQSELGTRASPFAAYITAMHRQIHKLWAFGFLADIEARGRSAYADDSLWTQLQIVVRSDGSVDKVGIVRSSGVLPFDVAAIDSVMSSAPFPPPPREIKSANGKVYLDWQFHRDERACGTFGVDPHILTTPGEAVPHDTSETGQLSHALLQAGQKGPRRLERERSPAAAPGPAPARPMIEEGLAVPEVTAEARSAAEGWFAAYGRGDAEWLAGWSATPFTAAGQVVAKDAAQLKTVYRQLLAEARNGRKLAGLEVLTPAGVRGRLGGLPPGGEDSGMLFGIGKAGGEEFILLLKKSSLGWRVAGLDR